MIPNLSGLRPQEPLRHRRGWQRQLRRPLIRQHRRPARPRIPNLSTNLITNSQFPPLRPREPLRRRYGRQQRRLRRPLLRRHLRPARPRVPHLQPRASMGSRRRPRRW